MASTVEVVLKENLEHLGSIGDVVRVRRGYARNLLLPRGLAVVASRGNVRQIEHEKAGLRRGFSVFDSVDSNAQIKDLLPAGSKPDVLDAIRNLISRAKNAGLSPEEAMKEARSPREVEAATVYDLYQRRLSTFNAVDSDDLRKK